MPELPEVETVKRILINEVCGKTVDHVEIYYSNCFKTDKDEFISTLKDKTIESITRDGKYLVFHFTDDYAVVSHLRMEGKYYMEDATTLPKKHSIMRYVFKDNTALTYYDVRKFGVFYLVKEDKVYTDTPLLSLGKEPFVLDLDEFYNGLQQRKNKTIKESILDQTLIAGIGNIYADETLFAAGINPRRKSNTITKDEAQSILTESIRILNMAINNGGSTIRSYHPKDGITGLMQNSLKVYDHSNEPCTKCNHPLRKIKIGGRGTTYCPKCQKQNPYIVGVTGPIASGKSTVTNYLKDKGYHIIDADKIIHELYKTTDVKNSVINLFGEESYINDTLNNKYILSCISSDKDKEQSLLNILYPSLYAFIDNEIESGKYDKIVLDVPLLINSPLENICDLIIYIEASTATQIDRLIKRGKNPEKSLELNKKYPRSLAKRRAGIVLNGDGTVSELIDTLDSYKFL